MPHIASTDAPVFELEGATFTGLASPSRGATENCVWRVVIAPGTPATPHHIDREETFVVLAGRASATVGDDHFELGPGDALVVPAHDTIALANSGDSPFEAVAVLPVGGRATIDGGDPFAPPWTQ